MNGEGGGPDAPRALLAALLAGLPPADLGQRIAQAGILPLAEAAGREHVAGLTVHALDTTTGAAAASLAAQLQADARACAARNLACLHEARRVQGLLAAAGIDCLWLKGVAWNLWLYPRSGIRDISDADLLVADAAQAGRAVAVLEPAGYRPAMLHVAGDCVVFERLLLAPAGTEVDLHWALANHALFADRIGWDALWQEAMPLEALAPGARTLSPPHALLQACMHRALGLPIGAGDGLAMLLDLHLLATRLDASQWQALVARAAMAGLAGVCLHGLEASRRLYGTAIPRKAHQRLQQASAGEALQPARFTDWRYLQRQAWRHLPPRKRARWLRQLLLPDMAHLRERYGRDGAGPARIVLRRLRDGWRRYRRYRP